MPRRRQLQRPRRRHALRPVHESYACGMTRHSSHRPLHVATLAASLAVAALGGCSSPPRALEADPRTDAGAAPPPGGLSASMRLAPRDPPEVAPPTRPSPAPIVEPMTRVEAPMLGEGLHFDIVTTEVVPPSATGDPAALRCTVRLRDESGAEVGIAQSGAKETFRQFPDGWTAPFALGRPTRVHFAGQAGQAGMSWEAELTPTVEATGRIRWTVTGRLVCTK